MTLGIIDVGTNSIHLLIGILGLHGTFHVILKERDLTRLGEGGLTGGRLTDEAMKRAQSVLGRYATTLKRCGADHVEAVATSAVREARNGRAFVRRVRSELGLPLRIISGREEARLIYLGVWQAVRFHRNTLIMTIGGGSAQVMCGDGPRLRYATSLPLGGARLAQRFVHHDPPRSEELEALMQYLQRAWRPAARALRRHRWSLALGSSATIYQLMLAAYLRQHPRPPKEKQRLSVTRASLKRLLQWLAMSTTAQRIRLAGVDPRREDLVLTTGMALLEWMEQCGVSSIRYAPGSLREGLVMDYLIRHHERQARVISASLPDLAGGNGRVLSLPWRTPLVRRLRRNDRQAFLRG